ncbi:MAG: hypothetical protein MJ091_06780 [Clostridia bacterium]|nr:hypothetical protein [Clostridia bacterium]
MGILEIQRKRSITGSDALRAYKIFIDGKEVESIKSGETKTVNLPEGLHTMQLKIDWCSSREVTFTINENQVTRAKCSPVGKGAFSLVSTVANKNNYITVEIL